MYEDYEDYYEPSEIDQLVEEFKDKCKEFIIPNIKEDIARLNKENLELKAKNEEYKKRDSELINKERELKYKAENLKREVEREFYKTNIEDTLKDFIEKSTIYFADNKNFEQPKCSLCNDERKLFAQFPDGKTATSDCKCSKTKSKYVPELAELTFIKFSKKDSDYQSDRKFYFSNSYSPSKKSSYDYDYGEFRLYQVLDIFDDKSIELHNEKKYGTQIGFITIEECQKYCNWLNKLKK